MFPVFSMLISADCEFIFHNQMSSHQPKWRDKGMKTRAVQIFIEPFVQLKYRKLPFCFVSEESNNENKEIIILS